MTYVDPSGYEAAVGYGLNLKENAQRNSTVVRLFGYAARCLAIEAVGSVISAVSVSQSYLLKFAQEIVSDAISCFPATSSDYADVAVDVAEDVDDCATYRAIPYVFTFTDGSKISDYDTNIISGVVYRALRSGESPSGPLFARVPGLRTTSPSSHIAGMIASPWISTSKSLNPVRSVFDSGNGVVAIDLTLVDTLKVDLYAAQGLAPRGRWRNAAIAHQEVLVLDCIPRRAIIGSV